MSFTDSVVTGVFLLSFVLAYVLGRAEGLARGERDAFRRILRWQEALDRYREALMKGYETMNGYRDTLVKLAAHVGSKGPAPDLLPSEPPPPRFH